MEAHVRPVPHLFLANSLIAVRRSQSLQKFEVLGGLVSGTEESRGKISLDRPNRQWDYPYVLQVAYISIILTVTV